MVRQLAGVQGQRAERRRSALWSAVARRSVETLRSAEAFRRQAGLASPSQAEELAQGDVQAQKEIRRAVRIGHKMGQPAALRIWYKIQPWRLSFGMRFLTRGLLYFAWGIG